MNQRLRPLALALIFLLATTACLEEDPIGRPSDNDGEQQTGESEISVSPGALYFEGLNPGEVSTQNIVISNIGDARLLVDSMEIVSDNGSDSTAFQVTQLSAIERHVQAGEAVTVDISFQPQALGTYAGILIIHNSDADRPEVSVRLSNTDPAEECLSACNRIYGDCESELVNDLNETIGISSCESRCRETDGFDGETSCIEQTTCDDDPVLTCIPEFAPEVIPVPEGDCEGLDEWPEDQKAMEEEVVVLVNEARSTGVDCGPEGLKPAVEPVVMEPILRCAARRHSKDMSDQDYFDHINLDGESPFDRIDAEGYEGGAPQGENIAAGYGSAEAVVEGWLQSPGHCSNIMEIDFKELGVGLYNNYWTQKFGGG